ncbi:MAG: MarR family transcriptional regulator [Sneathiella sp.]|nr:MarR family transcriptional regulator [Sneathiella sp.]
MDNKEQLSLTLDQLIRAAREIQYSEDLVPAQWEALRYLARANKYSLTPSMVANFLGTTKGTASQTLRSLESKGYVKRVQSTLDKRVTIVTPTPAGLEKLETDPLGTVLKLVDGEGREEKEILLKSLERLLTLMKTQNNGCHFGYCPQCRNFQKSKSKFGNENVGFCRLANEELKETEISKICAKFTQLPTFSPNSPKR